MGTDSNKMWQFYKVSCLDIGILFFGRLNEDEELVAHNVHVAAANHTA
jgi:hypothetical protein